MVNSYVAVDLETTGLDPKRDKIIEIGAVRIEDGKAVGDFESFVNPYRLLKEETMALTGIADRDVEDARGLEEILPEFLAFAGELPILGHNILFDYSFLKRAAVNTGREFEREGIDTLALARLFMPQEEKKNLKAACQWFGVTQKESHRAMADAAAAHRLYQAMKERYGGEKPEAFSAKNLIYKVKKEQPASKRQKEHLQDLVKYHKISLTVQIDHLSRNEISRITDKIIAQYGRI